MKATPRTFIGLLAFIIMLYAAHRAEHLVTPFLIGIAEERLHLGFSPAFSTERAVPVNLLTLIVVLRSVYVLAATAIALRIERKPWSAAGFAATGGLRFYLGGFATGFVCISVLVAIMWLSGSLTFDGLQLHGSDIVAYCVRWLIGLLLVGVAEEGEDRGYALLALSRIAGKLPAVLIISFIFAAGHAGNPGENILGLAQVFLFGVVTALSVFRTGSLWWAVGFHGMWDWAQEYFYGTEGSGYWYDGHLFQFRPHGVDMLSGGTVGPEGSLFVFLILGALLLREVLAWRGRPWGSTSH